MARQKQRAAQAGTAWPAHEVVRRKVAQLVPYARNARTHSEGQVAKLAASIREFGWTVPVLIDEEGTIIAGHGRVMAARLLGIAEVPCIVARGWTQAQRRAYVIADNQLALDAGWDREVLQVEVADLAALDFNLELLGFPEAELKGLREVPGEPLAVEDEIPAAPPRATTVRGDVWILGRHRVACGDCFRDWREAAGGAQVAAVATDPPYAIYGSSTGVSSEAADDKMVLPFFEKVLALAHAALPWFGHAYVFCDWRSWAAVTLAARASDMTVCNMLVWDKGDSGMGANYLNCHELVGFFAKKPRSDAMGRRPKGNRGVIRPNVIRANRVPHAEKEHNAAKPVALVEELIQNSTDAGDLVLEPFAGSGSTLVACERLGRSCAAVEMEPRMVDVVVRRWQKLTGREATLEAGGATFDEVAKSRAG